MGAGRRAPLLVAGEFAAYLQHSHAVTQFTGCADVTCLEFPLGHTKKATTTEKCLARKARASPAPLLTPRSTSLGSSLMSSPVHENSPRCIRSPRRRKLQTRDVVPQIHCCPETQTRAGLHCAFSYLEIAGCSAGWTETDQIMHTAAQSPPPPRNLPPSLVPRPSRVESDSSQHIRLPADATVILTAFHPFRIREK